MLPHLINSELINFVTKCTKCCHYLLITKVKGVLLKSLRFLNLRLFLKVESYDADINIYLRQKYRTICPTELRYIE